MSKIESDTNQISHNNKNNEASSTSSIDNLKNLNINSNNAGDDDNDEDIYNDADDGNSDTGNDKNDENNQQEILSNQKIKKEEIRRRLAFDEMDDVDDDPIAQYKNLSRKNQKAINKTLTARMQNLDSLQICFLNENNENYTFGDLNHTTATETKNNDIVMQNRIYYLIKKLQQVNFEIDQVNLFADLEKPTDKSKFSEYHSKLYTEAKFILSQVKEICKLKLKIEKENEQRSPSIYDLIHNFPPDFQKGVTKLTRPILKRLRMSELQLIVNDHFSRIEKLNSSLVKFLITRDESYMEQDSLLVDIEDLTKFLLSK